MWKVCVCVCLLPYIFTHIVTFMLTDVLCQQSRIRRNDRHQGKPVWPVQIPFGRFPLNDLYFLTAVQENFRWMNLKWVKTSWMTVSGYRKTCSLMLTSQWCNCKSLPINTWRSLQPYCWQGLTGVNGLVSSEMLPEASDLWPQTLPFTDCYTENVFTGTWWQYNPH